MSKNNEPENVIGNESGAIPSIDSNNSDVLGAPVAKSKAKTNVGKAAILGIILVGFLFIVVGLALFQKARHKHDDEAQTSQIEKKEKDKPAFETDNTAIDNKSIESTKAAIKKQEEDTARIQALAAQEEARKAQEAAQRAHPAPAMIPGGIQQNGNAPGPDGGRAAQGGPSHASSSSEAPRTGVLLELDGSKPKKGIAESHGTIADAGNGPQSSQQAQVQSRLQALYGSQGRTAPSTASARPVSTTVANSAGSGAFGSKLQPTVLQAGRAGHLPDLDYLLKKGTIIPCTLITGIDTTVPGFVTCNVTRDVYSANKKVLLVERGATVFGEQNSSLHQGEERTFVLWTRIDNPSGIFANVDSPASDQMGYSGIPGYVDTHFWQRFGGAIMLSMIRDYSSATAERISGDSSSTNYSNTVSATDNMAAEALKNTINIAPTLTVLPGTLVNVMVARDVSFENVYSVVE